MVYCDGLSANTFNQILNLLILDFTFCFLGPAFQINIIDDLIEQTCQVEEKILEYSSYFFDHQKAKASQTRQNSNDKYRGTFMISL